MIPRRVHSILIVEDERIVAKDLQQTLGDMGYDAYAIASSSDEAIARASEKCPDVVLMDIHIKGQRDGIQTAEILKQKFGVAVVYLTAHADDATIERAKYTEPERLNASVFFTSSRRSAATSKRSHPPLFPAAQVSNRQPSG